MPASRPWLLQLVTMPAPAIPTDEPAPARAGAAVAFVLAATLTAVDAVVLAREAIDPVWAWLQIPVIVLAWTVPSLWLRRRWAPAGLALLATLGGLWGYFYIPPLLALVLAGIAFWRAAVTSTGRGRDRAQRPSPRPAGPR